MLWWWWWLWEAGEGCSEWEGDKEQQAQQHQCRNKHRLLFSSSCSPGAWPSSHGSWELPYALVLGDNLRIEEVGPLTETLTLFLFLLICHYGEIFSFSGKCASYLRKYMDIGQPHWCGHCDLGKQSKKHWLLEHRSTLLTHATGVPMKPCNSILVSRVFRVRGHSLVSSKTVSYQYNLQDVAENCSR